MRNIFGYAATAVAAGAVSFFAAAGYADQNPDSFLGSCFHQVRYLCRSGTETASPCTEATSPCPMACGHEEETSQPTIRFEPLAPASSSNRLPGTIVINEDDAVHQTGASNASEPEPCEVPEQVRLLMKGLSRLQDAKDVGVEACAPTAPFMPYCEDDEPAPAVMPYAEESRMEKVGGSFLEFWTSFFRWPGAEESSEPPMGHAPNCKEDPAIHQQYPGVPAAIPAVPGKMKKQAAPFEEELQEVSPLPKSTPDFKNLLKRDGTLGDPKKHGHLDTTECRPSDFGFDNLGLRPF
jgi:hypothetical protein